MSEPANIWTLYHFINHGCQVISISPSHHSRLNTELLIRLTRWVPLVEEELLALPVHLSSSQILWGSCCSFFSSLYCVLWIIFYPYHALSVSRLILLLWYFLIYYANKIKNKKYHDVTTVPKSNPKTRRKRNQIEAANTYTWPFTFALHRHFNDMWRGKTRYIGQNISSQWNDAIMQVLSTCE